MDHEHLVFLSYSSPDRDEVQPYFDHLDALGYDVWMDVHRLKGGQNWDLEIKRAMQKAAIIVVFLSHNSVDRRGYAHKEIRIALEQKETRLYDDIYVIPVLIHEDLRIPEQLSSIQAIGVTNEDRFSALIDAIDHQLNRFGLMTEKAQLDSGIRWSFSEFKEAMEGLPGYDVRYRLIQLRSKDFPRIGEITDIIRGWLLESVAECRKVLFRQSSELINFGTDRNRRQDVWEADCGEPSIKGRIISINYEMYWYGTGAAHGNTGFKSFSFSLDPLVKIESLSDLFRDSAEALKIIQDGCRSKLTERGFTQDWVFNGTSQWDDFENFVFSADGVDLIFAPYAVAPYAAGPQLVSISYADLAPHMYEEIASLLEITHLRERTIRQ